MDKDLWTQKYAPKKASEIKQPNIKLVREFLANGKGRRKSLIIYGPTGSGKTSSVYALANELELEIVDLNASDFRNSQSISAIAGNASKQKSLFSKGKIILIDELDGISGNEDRGGVSEIASIMEKTNFPIIMTANDPFDRKLSPICKKSALVEYYPLPNSEVLLTLEKICVAEAIEYEHEALKALSYRSAGDLRGAINDLAIIAQPKKKITKRDVEQICERDREGTMTESLLKIFKTTDMKVAISAFDNLEEDMEKCAMWIDENLPDEYKNREEIHNAYSCLSKSDIFKGRITRSQYWRFLVYINAFISAGVAISKTSPERPGTRHKIEYRQSSRPLKIYISNQKNARLKDTAAKISEKTNCSLKKTMRHYMPYLKQIAKNSAFSKKISNELELERELI